MNDVCPDQESVSGSGTHWQPVEMDVWNFSRLQLLIVLIHEVCWKDRKCFAVQCFGLLYYDRNYSFKMQSIYPLRLYIAVCRTC
jgi:hypothetical protein